MGTETPKQYLPLLDRPIIHWSLDAFLKSARVSSVTVILSEDDVLWANHALHHSKLAILRCGGTTRAQTVLNGLNAVNHIATEDWVLVHDAARPCMTIELLNALLDALQHDAVGGLLAIPLADTLKRADTQQRVAKTEPRENLWQAQTPQMFRHGVLMQALNKAGGAPTDEAQALEALGLQPKLVEGQARNLKVTYPQDLRLAQTIIAADMREKA